MKGASKIVPDNNPPWNLNFPCAWFLFVFADDLNLHPRGLPSCLGELYRLSDTGAY